jgi:hypothetical protein
VSIRQAAGPKTGGVPYCGVGLFIDRGRNGCMVCDIEQGSAAEASGAIEVGDCIVQVTSLTTRRPCPGLQPRPTPPRSRPGAALAPPGPGSGGRQLPARRAGGWHGR